MVTTVSQPENHEHLLIIGLVQFKAGEVDLAAKFASHTRADGMLNGQVGQDIQKALQAGLPAHSTPSHLLRVHQIPTTATGKVDRRRFRDFAQRLLNARHTQPTDSQVRTSQPVAVKQQIRQLRASVLKVAPTRISNRDNFLQLGGDSIGAIELCSLARECGIDIRTLDVFNTPVVGQLLARISHKERDAYGLQRIPNHSSQGSPVQLSSAQRHMWFLDQLNPGFCAYLIPLAARIRGPFNLTALHDALRLMGERHVTLRTVFEERD